MALENSLIDLSGSGALALRNSYEMFHGKGGQNSADN